MRIQRRTVLKAGLGGLCTTLLPYDSSRGASQLPQATVALIADLHFGLEPTAPQRIDKFMQSVDQKQPDALLQLGDFNYGDESSRECMEFWTQFAGPRHHVLGNHDMDKFSKEHMLEAWSMPHRFYSFDLGGFHFVILDRNHLKRDGKFIPYEKANFYVPAKHRGFADPEQLEWLREDLNRTELPTLVFSHQGLGMPDQVHPPAEANRAIEQVLASDRADGHRPSPVVACFCGHHHIDRYHFKDGIHYVWVNSASYYWVGAKYGRMAPYTKPLFAYLHLHPEGVVEIEGRQADWVPPSPAERGYPGAERLNTVIRDRELEPRLAHGAASEK